VSHIVHYFKDADMRCGHDGLKALARKHRYRPEVLSKGEFLLFVNAKQTIAKVLGEGNALLHIKSETGRLELKTLRYLPQIFGGKAFGYAEALKLVIEKDFKEKRR
jgi:hypothetical protein